MPRKNRKAIPVDVTQKVMHEAGYKCANPACRYPITLDRHHIEAVSDGGQDRPENLVPLCPTCHTEHHNGQIPKASIRPWKMLLLTMNEAFDRRMVDTLLLLDRRSLTVTSDALLTLASLVASNLVDVIVTQRVGSGDHPIVFQVRLSEKGKRFVDGWKAGKQEDAIPASITELSGK